MGFAFCEKFYKTPVDDSAWHMAVYIAKNKVNSSGRISSWIAPVFLKGEVWGFVTLEKLNTWLFAWALKGARNPKSASLKRLVYGQQNSMY